MAQLMIETLPASNVSGVTIDGKQGVLTVSNVMASQLVGQPDTVPVMDDSDVFLCGRCKKQFLSIEVFVNHKAECSNSTVTTLTDLAPVSTNICGLPQNTILVQKIQIPSSNYPQSLVLADADLLQLATPSLDLNPAVSQAQTFPALVQHILHDVGSQTSEPQTIELSFNVDKLLSRPFYLTQQADGTGVVLNLCSSASNEHSDATMILNLAQTEQVNNSVVNVQEEVLSSPETEKNVSNDTNKDPNSVDQNEPSTVNIITEFHSSMVKSRKDPAPAEGEDNQAKKDSKLNCAYCSKIFTKNFDLQQHIRCHTGEKPFQCVVCGRAFAQKSNVKKHMQTHKVWPSGLAKTLPDFVSKNSSSCPDEGSNHEITSSDVIDPSNESECEKSEVDKKSSYACCYCSYIGNSYYKLKTHMIKHDTEKVYKCIVKTCGQMFNELDSFLEHTKCHESERTYRCHDCSRNFPSLNELGNHQFTHCLYPNTCPRTKKRVFKCNLCLNKYATPAALDHHIETTSHAYMCQHCNKMFPCERYLRRHLQIHSQSDAFTCNVCNKGFKTECYLKIHMLVHSEEKPFQCNVCKAAFNRKDKLKRHLLIHEPVKKYKCPSHDGCGKEFSRADKLKAHLLTHGAKPFTCKDCGKTFNRRAQLRDHYKLFHDEDTGLKQLTEDIGERPVPSCMSSFSDSDESRYSDSDRRKRKKSSAFLSSYRKGRSKKQLSLADFADDSNSEMIDDNSEMIDDIPTAHIEIISTHEIVSTSDLTLTTEMGYGDLHFEDDANDPSVEDIHSNSLLSNDLQEPDISDFS